MLRSPIDGIVGNRTARRGTYATVGAPLISIVPTEGLWVDANFKESQLAHIRPGLAARITADALPGEVLEGRVVSVAPATGSEFSLLHAENATGNFTKIVQRVPVRIGFRVRRFQFRVSPAPWLVRHAPRWMDAGARRRSEDHA